MILFIVLTEPMIRSTHLIQAPGRRSIYMMEFDWIAVWAKGGTPMLHPCQFVANPFVRVAAPGQ